MSTVAGVEKMKLGAVAVTLKMIGAVGYLMTALPLKLVCLHFCIEGKLQICSNLMC